MIDISNYINSDTILTEMDASTKEEAVRLLVDKIYQSQDAEKIKVPKEEVYKAVIDRESLQSTGIGNELAFPHARIEGWGEFRMAMGVLKEGLDFSSMDSKPVKFVFLMISSQDQPYMVLQAMSAIIRFLGKMGHSGEVVTDSRKISDMLERMQEQEIEATENILARDIVRPVDDFVTLETPLEDVTSKMHLKRISILPVVTDDDKFYGELSCYDIFTFGMPDFFKQLKTISFVRHIDPFEKYFSIKKGLRVKDIQTLKRSKPMKKDSTLLEIVFEMAVRKKSKLFMVEDDGTLGGVIDRFCIIDRILFF